MQNYAEPADTTGSKSRPTNYRIVVDTNVLVSAFIYGGAPARVLEHIIRSHTPILSDHIVDELIAYLKIIRPKISQKWVRALREQLSKHCYEDSMKTRTSSRDPKDNPVLALALTQNAFVLSGDNDLLQYTADGRTVVLSVREYQELFEVL